MSDLPVRSCAQFLFRPGRFLLAFTVLAGLLLLLWSRISGYYLAGLAALANAALAAAGVPLCLELPAAAGPQIVHPGVIGAVALFAATAERPFIWKAKWLGLVLAGLCLLHTSLLFADACHAYVQTFQPAATGRGGPPAAWIALAKQWAPLLGVVTAWFIAVGRGLGQTLASPLAPGPKAD